MYNRYIPRGTAYVRVQEEDGDFFVPPGQEQEAKRTPPGNEAFRQESEYRHPHQGQERQKSGAAMPFFDLGALLGGRGGKKEHTGGITGMLKALKLDDLDTGDILLMLILLFLFLEGDNTELVITLGLMLLLGLGDKDKKEEETGS